MPKTKEVKKFLSKILPEDVGGKPGIVRFVLGNGVEVQLDITKTPETTTRRLTLHGASQKVGDAAANFSKASDYHGAFGAMQSVVDNLYNDVWSNRSGGGTADLVAALAELQGLEVSAVQEVIDKADDETLKTLRTNPQVKAKIADMIAARAAEAAKAAKADDLGSLWADITKG